MFEFFASKFSGLISSITGVWSNESRKKIELELKKILIDADVSLKMVEAFCAKVLARFDEQIKQLPRTNKRELLHSAIYQELLVFLGQDHNPVQDWPQNGVLLFMGLQGAGKTTTIAKIGKWLNENRPNTAGKVLCASVDFHRPAAIMQLEIMAKKAGINFIPPLDLNIEKTIRHALEVYKNQSGNFLLIDTAGRLNLDYELMAELKQINTLCNPKLKVLVLDSMTGQKSLEVAQDFELAVGVDRAILTKMDSDSRAGSALSLGWVTKKPISFITTGEKIEDLEPFIASRCASRIVGAGDVATLSDKLENQIKKTGQEANFSSMANRMMAGNFTLQDFIHQIEMVNSIGSIAKVASYLPGMGSLSSSQVEQGEKEMALFKSIIQSMTPKERLFPAIINQSRKKRICLGAGRNPQELDRLLEKFEQSKRFAKILSGFGR
jgi:signal recognition particle subunit SRP54